MTHEDPEVRWASYVDARARIHHPSLGWMKVAPAPLGVTDGPFPPGEDEVFIITAANPGRLLSDAENAQRFEQLRLVVAAATPAEIWDAAGGDESWTHVEASVALTGITLSEALSIGRSFDQEAIFAWTRDLWQVVDCRDGTGSRAGWRATRSGGARATS